MPLPLTRDCLSERDRQVLDSIFNPLELTSAPAIDAQTDAATLRDDEDELELHNAGDLQKSLQLEIAAVQLADKGELSAALEKFADALSVTPQPRASVLNNRAQAFRLAGRDSEALDDLNAALELCGTKLLRTKCNALCQRGVLRRKANELDVARLDFEAAATLGSKFAKQQLIEINPYAALCNQMLRQAFEQLK